MDPWDNFSRIDLEAQTTPEILSRGSAYYHEGHLLQAARIGTTRAGILAGTGGNYRARLWFDNGVLHTACTCPYQGFCKHLVAVAVGWLTEPAIFCDLQSELERILANPSLLQETIIMLCRQEPFLFEELLARAYNITPVSPGFHSARGILNLIRNTFANPRESLAQGSQIWEKINRLQKLLQTELSRGSPAALASFVELIKGLASVYLDYPAEQLTSSFNEMMAVLREIPPALPGASIEMVLDLLLDIYCEPKLWEWKQSCGEGILELVKLAPDALRKYLGTKQLSQLTMLELISLYELLLILEPLGGPGAEFLAGVEKSLKGYPAGLLWLVDRWLEADPDCAFRLANEGARRFDSHLKVDLWDRLVKLHFQRGEFKQAAALSFALFQKEPCFEEYLRLRGILQDRPYELREYCQKVRDFLENRCDRESRAESAETFGLLVKIAVTEGNHQLAREYCAASVQTPTRLLEIARLCCDDSPGVWRGIYPFLIRALLSGETAEMWKTAHQILTLYKKICLQQKGQEEWELFRGEICHLYEDDCRFQKRFGALLID